MDRGILLIANGHPLYGFYAHNLVVGLKYHSPEIPVALVTDWAAINGLDNEDRGRFDIIIDTKKEWITGHNEKTDYLKCKLHIGEITPFNKTLYLDVDMQWCVHKTPADAFDSLNGIEFTIANRGEATGNRRTEWMDLSEGEKYGVTKLYDISSEWIYFESPTVMNKAVEIYNENRLKVDEFDLNVPDEPYISMAMAVCGIEPHKSPYVPTYWQPWYHSKFHNIDFIYDNHYAMSIGGRANPAPIRQKVDALTGKYFYESGINKNYYKAQDKQRVFTREGRRQKR